MEDLWKEITLSTFSSFHNRRAPTPHNDHHHFQDFLGRPLPLDQTKNSLLLSAASSPAPQTILSLSTDSSSGHSLPNFDNSTLQKSGSDEMSLSSSQRLPSDRRFKRMIKNRESAARSRARKQAYTSELELEVAHLKQENARLRMEQEMRSQAALDQYPKKHKLHRASTAPF